MIKSMGEEGDVVSILEKIKKNKIQLLVLLLVVAVHVGFVSWKEGYHMDELLSFELANAEYNPWIVPTQPQGRLAKFMQEEVYADTLGETAGNFFDAVKDVLQNRGGSKLLGYQADVYEEPVWISREEFQAYVTTGQRDQFNLISVYFNVKDDNHPPVHFMLLHLISSIFPGSVSVWMGCFINLCTLVGICACMMAGGKLLEKHGVLSEGFGRKWGILAAVFYGFSAGAVATTLLIRMYGLMTFCCVLSLYLHVKKWLEGSFDKKNKGLIAVTVIGFLTQYFFLFYCILLAVVTVVLLWTKKRIPELKRYIRSMVIAAVLGVCLFPFAIADVLSSGRGVEALQNLGNGWMDFFSRIGTFGKILLESCFGNLWLGLVILVAFTGVGIWTLIGKKKSGKGLVWMLILPPVGYFLLASKMSPMFADRYIMAVFPFVAMMAALVWVWIADKCKRFEIFLHVAVSVAFACLLFTYNGTYLYEGYEEQLEVSEEYEELACICLYEGSGYYDNLLEFRNYEKTLLVTPAELLARKDVDEINALDELVIVKKGIIQEKDLQEILQLYHWEIAEVLIEDGACYDTVYLCRRVER